MQISYDKKADALAIWFNNAKSEKTIDVAEDVFIDFTGDGRLAGIEILHASEKADISHLLDLLL